jgi:hypothetical protein
MSPELEAIKDQLTTRNVIAWAQESRYAVNCVRTNHHEHVVFATCNGRVIDGSEKLFVGVESFPRQLAIFRLQNLYEIGKGE